MNRLNPSVFNALRGTVILKLMAIGSSLAASVVTARILGAEEYGYYTFALSIGATIGLPTTSGLPTMLVREAAKSRVNSEWSTLKSLAVWSNKVIILTFVLATLAIAIVWLSSVSPASSKQVYTLAIGTLATLLIAAGNARGALLRGLGFVVRGQLPEFILQPTISCGFLLAISLYTAKVTAFEAILLYAVAASITYAIGSAILHQMQPLEFKNAVSENISTSKWARSLIPLSVLSGMSLLNNHLIVILLGTLRNTEEVGLLKAAISCSSLASFGMQVVNLALAPTVVQLHELKDQIKLQKLAALAAGFSGIWAVTFFLALLYLGPLLIEVSFGPQFHVATAPMLILAGGQVVNGLFGSVGVILIMTGGEQTSTKIRFISTATTILASTCLIPTFGVNGAAVGLTIGLTTFNIFTWQAVRKGISIDGSCIATFRQLTLGLRRLMELRLIKRRSNSNNPD